MTAEKKCYEEPLLQFGKWIVHKGYWVSDNGEMILMTDGSPSRQISDGYRVVFAVHLRDMCMAMEKDLGELKRPVGQRKWLNEVTIAQSKGD
jgi:hypothetical protein